MNEGNVMERLEKAEWVLQNSGFRRCDIPACNCNSWHQVGGYAERFREIKEAVEDAGYSTNGKILLDVIKEVLTAPVPRSEVQTAEPVACRWRHVNDETNTWHYQSGAANPHNEYIEVQSLYVGSAQQALPTRCDNCGRAFLPDDTVFASVNHGVRRTVHLMCGGQTASDRGKLSDDKIMDILRKVTKGQLYDLLTCKRWKDGIDIDSPTFAAQWLALEFCNANTVSDRIPAHTSALVDQIANIVSDYYDEDDAGRWLKCAQHITDSITASAQAAIDPRRIIDWTYLYATEGAGWPDYATITEPLIKLAARAPTHDDAERLKIGASLKGLLALPSAHRASPKPPADMRQIFNDGDNTHRRPK